MPRKTRMYLPGAPPPPLAAGMVNNPGQYPWSSYRANACCEHDVLIEPHPVYQRLGKSPEEQSTVYRHLFGVGLRASDICDIRRGIKRNYPVASHRFKVEIEEALGRKLGTGRRGRPLKARQVDQ